MRWLDGITNSMDVSLSEVGDGQGGLACCNSWGCKELDTTERLLFVCVCSCPYLCVLFPEGRGEHLNRQVRLQSPRRRHLVGEIQTCNKGTAQLTLLIHISVVLPASGATLTTCQVPSTRLHIANYILPYFLQFKSEFGNKEFKI